MAGSRCGPRRTYGADCAGRARRQERGGLDRAIVDTASARAKGIPLTRPNPVDRGKKGSKSQVLSEAQGIPLAAAVSRTNSHVSQAFKPLIPAAPADRSRRGPRRRKPVKVRADKGYHSADHLA
ncbi:transposase [Streptomyces asiaticus]|uniref:transposase n=1 Tax=Streptomyces asiaticus TaxID=114695 RepID=UPI003D7341E9